jgi:hypothetical protein
MPQADVYKHLKAGGMDGIKPSMSKPKLLQALHNRLTAAVRARERNEHSERFADVPHDEVALAGPDGVKAAKLLGKAKDAGARTLYWLARRAVQRLLETPDPQAAKHLFDADEFTRLADQLAAVNATANLLGRARIRERADQAERRQARKMAEAHEFAGFNPADHPRDDDGQFVSAGDLKSAKADPAKATALRAKVTDPGERAKLEKKLGGTAGAQSPSPSPPSAPLAATTGHPAIDQILNTPAPPPEKVRAIYEAAKHYGDLQLAGKGGDSAVIRGHVEEALKDASPAEVRATAAGVDYFPAPKENTVQIKEGIIRSVIDRAGMHARSHMEDSPKKVRAEALARLAAGGFKFAETFAEEDSFLAFAEPPPPLAPESAISYFKSLVPAIGVDPHRFGQTMQRESFTLAHATDTVLLDKVKAAIADTLETGDTSNRIAQIEKLLDDAGVGRNNAAYAENILRTNCMDSYVTGIQQEVRTPEMMDAFPVWEFLGIADGRQRPAHEVHFDKFFPNSASFGEVRDSVKGEYDGFQCRCVPNPVDKYHWEDLQKAGATVETSW